jgi:hypothetical protein
MWLFKGVAPFLAWALWTNVTPPAHGPHGPHGSLGHRAGAAALTAALLAMGMLATSGRQGSRHLCGILAVAYGYLGISALVLPHHDGSCGPAGGFWCSPPPARMRRWQLVRPAIAAQRSPRRRRRS